MSRCSPLPDCGAFLVLLAFSGFVLTAAFVAGAAYPAISSMERPVLTLEARSLRNFSFVPFWRASSSFSLTSSQFSRLPSPRMRMRSQPPFRRSP